MSWRFRWICAALLSVFFGSSYSIFSKYLLQWTIPETLLLIAQMFSVITVLLFFWLVPEMKEVWKMPNKRLVPLACVALFSWVLSPLLYMKWLSETTAINAIVTSRMSAIFLWIIWFLRLKEKCTLKRVVWTLLMFLWVVYITTKWFTLWFAVDYGVYLVLVAALASATWSTLYKKYLADVPPEVVILFRNGIAMLVFIFAVPVLLSVQHDVTIWFQQETWIYFAWLALIPIVLSQYLNYEAIDHAPVSLIGAMSLISPLSWMMLAYVFLWEQLYIYHAIGALLLICGLWINLMKFPRWWRATVMQQTAMSEE